MNVRFTLQCIKILFFWIFFFGVNRLFFTVYQGDKLHGISLYEVSGSFYHALHLDISAACYITVLPLFFLWMFFIFNKNIFNTINNIFHFLIIILISIISTTDLALYDEWSTKLHYKALLHLQYPQEVIASAASSPVFLLTGLLLAQIFIGIFIYNKVIRMPTSVKIFKSGFVGFTKLLFSFLVLVFLLIIGMRGGFQEIPVNQSNVYFSQKNILNHLAVNSPWSLIHSISENWENLDTNPYDFYTLQESELIIRALHNIPSDTTTSILTTIRPNIILIITEGWTSDIIQPLGGLEKITPNFNEFSKEGILFTNFYASGMRSDKGIVAILSAYPSQPATSITTQPNKFEQLPCLIHELKKVGYHSSFYFGGELNYGNIKSYLLFNQFEKIIETSNFSYNTPRAKLGVHDEYVFNKVLQDLETNTQPFFTSVFTLSSHEPFDIPEKWQGKIEGKGESNDYLNAVHYSDHCIGKFITEAKQKQWFNNTLFLIVSDHSHHWPLNRPIYRPERHKIPFLIYGEALKNKYKGTKNDKIAGHVDIAATLLSQLGLKSNNFFWSKDLFNPLSPEFGLYTFIEGFGFIENGNSFSYENRFKKVMHEDFSSEDDGAATTKKGKAYMQIVFQDYLNK